jgi:hypothetical protein
MWIYTWCEAGLRDLYDAGLSTGALYRSEANVRQSFVQGGGFD